MNVLITGGAGFIGYHLARYHVGRGHGVFIVDNFFKTNHRPDPEFQELARRRWMSRRCREWGPYDSRDSQGIRCFGRAGRHDAENGKFDCRILTMLALCGKLISCSGI